MISIALDFENSCQYLHYCVLVVPGLVMLISGLCLWLAGGLKPAVFTSIFTAIVFFATACLFRINMPGKVIALVSGLVLGSAANKKAIIASTAITAAMVSIIAVYWLNLQTLPAPDRYYNSFTQQLNFADSLTYFDSFSSFVLNQQLDWIKNLNKESIAITAAASAAAGVLAFFFTRFATAVICSLWGTVLISKGLILLLLYKGTLAITRFSQNMPLYLTIALVMFISAAGVQLILCSDGSKKDHKSNQKQNDGDEK